MNPRQPRLTAAEVIRVLEARGFRTVRQSGSHLILRNEQGRRVTVPVHAGKTLHPKILASIMTDAGLTSDDFK